MLSNRKRTVSSIELWNLFEFDLPELCHKPHCLCYEDFRAWFLERVLASAFGLHRCNSVRSSPIEFSSDFAVAPTAVSPTPCDVADMYCIHNYRLIKRTKS